MKTRVIAAVLLALVPLISAVAGAPGLANAHTQNAAKHTLSSHTFTLQANGGGSFTGKFVIRHFVVQNHRLMAQGTFQGTLKDKNGTTHQITHAANVPVQKITSGSSSMRQMMQGTGNTAQPAGSCTILHLVLGPITLNLLGLVVQTNQIVVDISGMTGPGQLLGNLLCGIAGINLTGLQQILLADLALILNQILTLL